MLFVYLSRASSNNRKSSCRFHVAFDFDLMNFNIVFIPVAVKLPNLKVIRLVPGRPHHTNVVKFPDFDELYLYQLSTNHFQTWQIF